MFYIKSIMKTLLLSLLLCPILSCNSQPQVANDSIIVADTIQPKSTITLLFAGDLMQHQAQIDAARTGHSYDYKECFKHVKHEISKADVAIANLEVTLGGKPYAGYPAFSAPDEFLFDIKDAGFDILLTANNHCLDRGKHGLERTIMMLDSLSVDYLGTYINEEERSKKYPFLLEQNGFRIALLNYTYGTNGIPVTPPNIVNFIDKKVMEQDIEQAKLMQPDIIIANMHWGEEYVFLPSKEQVELTDWLLSKGVDHVIGSHPHVVQPMELRTDCITGAQNIVVYSLGNFISNMSKRGTDGGLMFKMTLEKDSVARVADCGYSMIWTDRPVISGKKNYVLYPINFPADSLNQASRNKLSIFAKDSKELFDKHNIGIKEYTFY